MMRELYDLVDRRMQRRFTSSFHTRSITQVAWCVSALLGAIGCVDAPSSITRSTPKDVLWSIGVTPHAILMAVNQTQQLTATARNILGDTMVLPDSVAVVYRAEDSTLVSVSAAGILTAKRATLIGETEAIPSRIYVSLSIGDVTKVDTAYVVVTDTAPTTPINTLRIGPPEGAPDSTWRALYTDPIQIPVSLRTTTGAIIDGAFAFLYTDARKQQREDVIDVHSRMFSFTKFPGEYWLYGEVIAYGTSLSDSTLYYILDPIFGQVQLTTDEYGNVQESGVPLGSSVTRVVTPCGLFVIYNLLDIPVTFTIDPPDPTVACIEGDETGNVITVPAKGMAIRKFRTPGLYIWRATQEDGSPFVPAITGKVRIRARSEL